MLFISKHNNVIFLNRQRGESGPRGEAGMVGPPGRTGAVGMNVSVLVQSANILEITFLGLFNRC